MLLSEHPKMLKIDALTNQGLDAYQTGNYPRALKKFEGCLRIEKDDLKVREAAAYSAVRAEDWPRAAKHWREVLRSDPRRAGPYQQYINALLQNRRFDEARAFCQTYKPLQKPALKGLRDSLTVRVHLMSGQTAEAQELASICFAAAPDTLDLLALAKWFFEAKVFSTAQQWLDRIPADHPKADQVKMLQARIAYERKTWDAATCAFKAVLDAENEAQVQTARVFLARIASHQGDQKQAEDRWQAVLETVPDHAEATTFLIRSALRDHNYAQALALLDDNWRNLDPVRRVHLKARALAATDRAAAVQFFRETLDLHPDLVGLRRDFAHFLLDMSDWDAGTAQTRQCLEIAPHDVSVHKLHLRLLQETDAAPQKQLDAAETASALAPLDVSLLNAVGGLLVRVDKRDAAVLHYMRAVNIMPDAAILWRNGAYHIAMENRPDAAVVFADRAIAHLGTKTPNDLANAAWVFQAAGDLDRALGYIEQAVDLDPSALRAQQIALDLYMADGNYAAAWACIGQIDRLQAPRRDPKTAHAAAQCVSAFRTIHKANGFAVSATPKPIEGRFPERLFHAIADLAQPDTDGGRTGILHLTSNLGPGGAERQVACVMQTLTEEPLPHDQVELVVNSLNAIRSNDFFLADIAKTGAAVIDLDVERHAATIRDVLSHHPECAEKVRILAALPAEVSRVAVPLFAHLIKTRPRIVHLWQDAINVAGGMAAMAAGVPHIVLCTRSTHPVEIRRFRRYLREGYLALFRYHGQVSVLNNSANGARDYANWLNIDADKIALFYNGYDFDVIRQRCSPQHREDIRASLGLSKGAKVIGGVMRFSAEKRPDLWVDTLIAAVGLQDDLHGLIVGDGPMRNDLVQHVADLGLTDRIHFVGRKSPIEPWMSAMDVLFLSSLTEGLPNVLIEAQAIGLPVATMNVGGAPEALRDGLTGIVLDEAPADHLATVIRALLNDGSKLAEMRGAAGPFVDGAFSMQAMRQTLENCYAPQQHKGGASC